MVEQIPADAPGRTGARGADLEVGVLLFEGVEPLDAVGPAQVFWSLGSARRFRPGLPVAEVHLVAERDGPLLTRNGFVVHPTTTYDRCPRLDVLVVPGGTGDDQRDHPDAATRGRIFQARHPPTLEFVRRQAAGARVVASVCTGAFILGAAGLIDGRRVATHWAARDELSAFMAERGTPVTVVAERVVEDGAVMTAGGVSSGIDLALAVLDRVAGAEAREAAAAVIERETPP